MSPKTTANREASEIARRKFERWGRVMQARAGAAPQSLEGDGTQGDTRLYMRRVNDGYEELHPSIIKWMGSAKSSPLGWKYANEWVVLYGNWKKFYDDTIDDFLISTDDQNQTDYFAAKLQKARQDYKGALGTDPPGSSVPVPSPDVDPPGEENPVQQVTSLIKWGVIGYLCFKLGDLVLGGKTGHGS